jgi:hypothetical protein
VGARSPQLQVLLGRVAAHGGGEGAREDLAAGVEPAGALASPAGLRLPSLGVSALLVAVFLGFGILMGNVSRPRISDTPASARSPLKLVLGAGATTSRQDSASSSGSSTSESSASEPPSGAEAEPTPAPAAKAKVPTSTPSRSSGTSPSSSPASEGGSGSQGESSESTANTPAKKLPPIKHVFVIMLSDEPYASVFGPSSTAPYLTGKLEHQGELLVDYHAVAHEELADEAALISGQGPTTETAANCPTYSEIVSTGTGADEQVLGSGCVYPRSTQTLAGELEAKHLTWRAYVQGIDEAGAQAGACARPALGATDPTANQAASSGSYATFRDPFVYFDSIVDSTECAADDIGLAGLKGDLAKAGRTPSFSYIVPDRCHDANPTPCTPGASAGVAQANAFLQQVVPEITASKAYKESGLLVITVDEAPSSGAFADSSSCCGQPLFPNAPATTLTGAPKGGGLVGALLLSPFVQAGTTNQEPYDDFSLLRTIEDVFGLPHLGYAGLSAVKSFEPAMFTAGKG